MLIAHGDFQLVEVKERHRNRCKVFQQRKQLSLFIRLARQFHADLDAVLCAGVHGRFVLLGGPVEKVKPNFVKPRFGKISGPLGVERNGRVNVDVMALPEGLL